MRLFHINIFFDISELSFYFLPSRLWVKLEIHKLIKANNNNGNINVNASELSIGCGWEPAP